MGVALSGRIERTRPAVMVDARRLDRLVQEPFQGRERDPAGKHLPALDPEIAPQPRPLDSRPLPHPGEQRLADGEARQLDRAARHHRLPGRRRRSRGSDPGVRRMDHDGLDAQFGADDLDEHRMDPLPHLGGGALHLGPGPTGAGGEPDARLG